MFRSVLTICAFALALAFAGAAPDRAEAADPAVHDAIRVYFPAHEWAVADAVASCETDGYDLYNEYSGAFGHWQFLPSTSYGMGFDHSLMDDPYYSTWAASRLQNAYGWSQWACA